MIEPDYSARLLLEPRQTLRIPSKARGQEFERGLAARCNVGGQIDVAHPAGADPFRNFVMADRLTDEQISLLIFNNPRGDAGNCGFNEGCLLVDVKRGVLLPYDAKHHHLRRPSSRNAPTRSDS